MIISVCDQETVTSIEDLAWHLAIAHPQKRLIVALAGASGSGKSVDAASLKEELEKHTVTAAIPPMDGYH